MLGQVELSTVRARNIYETPLVLVNRSAGAGPENFVENLLAVRRDRNRPRTAQRGVIVESERMFIGRTNSLVVCGSAAEGPDHGEQKRAIVSLLLLSEKS